MSSNEMTASCVDTSQTDQTPVEVKNDRPSPAARMSTMTKLVRMVGAGLLVVSASTFMIQQWDLGNDLVRYLVLLGHTSVLAAAGFFCGIKIKESRGARTFLGLVLVSIPVHFAVLGGLVYSQFSLDGVSEQVQQHVMWTASSPGEALGLVGLGLAVLLPICMVAMATFARPYMKQLTASYLAMNLALLVPVRGADAVGLLVAAAVVVFCVFQRALFFDKPLLRNLEGRFVRLMLLAPVCVIIGRSIYLYELSGFCIGCLFMSISSLAFFFAPRFELRERSVRVLQGLSTIPAAIGWCLIAHDLISSFDIPFAMQIPSITLPISSMLVAMSFHAKESALLYRRIAALMAMVPLCINLIAFSGIWVSLVCLAVGIVTLVYGVYIQQKLVALVGGTGLAFGVLYHLSNMIHVETLSHWAVLSVIGICLIIGTSVFERRSSNAVRYLAAVRTKLSAWEY